MLMFNNIELYFFDHFIPYPRDEKTIAAQNTSRPPENKQIAPPQRSRRSSNPKSGRSLAAALGQTAHRPAGSIFGVPPAQTQEAHSLPFSPGRLFAGHTPCGLLSALGWPHRLVGPMHLEQTSSVRTHDRPSRHLFEVDPASPRVLESDPKGLDGSDFLAPLRPGLAPRQHRPQAFRETGPLFPGSEQSARRSRSHAQNSNLLRFAGPELCPVFLEF